MNDATFASRTLRFYRRLSTPTVPSGVAVMNPYKDRRVIGYVSEFLDRYFADNAPRVLVFGINPGRFGAGITGITFTDPVALADFCGVANDLQRKRELSSIFIYDFIQRYGGAGEFYRRFFLTAMCPLGFTRGGLNLNYYDVPALARAVEPFIVKSDQSADRARRAHRSRDRDRQAQELPVLRAAQRATRVLRQDRSRGAPAIDHAVSAPSARALSRRVRDGVPSRR